MPWSQGQLEERQEMIALWESGWTPTQLAAKFGVSRQTIYTFTSRWSELQDKSSLEDRSRRPHSSPTKTPAKIERLVLAVKEQHPDYGPKKISALLELDHGIVLAPSTTRDVLRRSGSVEARRGRTPRWSPAAQPIFNVPGPGHSISADYKGQFRLGNHAYCYPLTIADPASRYVFAVESMVINSGASAKRVFERVFREWGVPEQMITDNGSPFCVSRSIGGLSELSRWWTRLGIRHVRIQPGRPQQNGIHERMHRTLKARATRPPERTHKAQQVRFDRFRNEFNHVRPHEGLGQKRPASIVTQYRRPFPDRLPEVEYPAGFTVRRVRSNGYIKWQGAEVFVGEILVGEPVGLVKTEEDVWHLYFGNHHLADWSDRAGRWVASGKSRP